MSDLRDVLIRGSEKIINHYRLFLAARRVKASAHFITLRSSENSVCWTNIRGRSERLAA